MDGAVCYQRRRDFRGRALAVALALALGVLMLVAAADCGFGLGVGVYAWFSVAAQRRTLLQPTHTTNQSRTPTNRPDRPPAWDRAPHPSRDPGGAV